MSEPRDLFSTSVLPGHSELKAHAALYAAREAAAEPVSVEPVVVTATPRVIPQGGADAARSLRERLVAEHKAVVVEAAARFAKRGRGGIPAAAILKFRLSDLPKLIQPSRDGEDRHP